MLNRNKKEVSAKLEKLEKENRILKDRIESGDSDSKLLFDSLADSANALIFEYFDGRLIYVNQAMAKTLGLPIKEIVMRSCDDFFEQDSCALLKEQTRSDNQHSKDACIMYDLVLKTSDSRHRYLTCTISHLSSTSGKRILVHGVDISQRKKIEQALRESEERYRTLTENAPDIMYTLDLNGRFTYVNTKWEKMLGHTRKEVLGSTFVDFSAEEDRGKFLEISQDLRTLKGVVELPQVRLLDKWGIQKWFSLSCAPCRNENSDVTGMVGIAKDITKQRKIEDRLAQAQKMEAIGTLAGGIAHDFNNILQSIQSYTQLLILQYKKDKKTLKRLKEIESSSKRASELTSQLLAFSQKAETRFQKVNVNDIVNSLRRLLEKYFSKPTRVKLILKEDIPLILADPKSIEQIIMNLAVNARDAMPEGGNLVIETGSASLDENYLRSHPDAQSGKHASISVSDTGHGMDADVLDHIFEPFYTTHEVGKGTGLGLATVYGIVKSHDGHITCTSKLGSGTTFRIFIPAVKQEEHETVSSSEVEGIPLKYEASVLLVDDEEALREVGREILEAFGYTVTTAKNGEEALEILQSSEKDVDLIILDLIMPGMGGQKCLAQILQVKPYQKVIVASGYAATGQAKEVLDQGAKAFISKPYDLEKMMKLIEQVMAAPSTES